MTEERFNKNKEIFINRLKNEFGDKYEVINAYHDSKQKAIVYTTKCNDCGYEKTAISKYFFKGFECRGCKGLAPYTTEEYKKQVFDLVGDEYTVLGEYISGDKHIKMRHNCKDCNNFEWDVIAGNFIRKDHPTRCKLCSNKKAIEKTKETLSVKAKEHFYDIFNNEILNSNNFELLSDYKNDTTHLLLKCKKCNNTFTRLPSSITIPKIIRCDYCEELSKPILKIIEFLNTYNIQYYKECYFPKFKSLKNGNSFRYDLFLPKYNLIIEYDGEQHFDKSNTYNTYDLELYDQLKNLKILLSSKYAILRISKTEVNKINEILYTLLFENSFKTINENKLLYINNDSSILYNYNEYYSSRNNNFSYSMSETIKFYLLDEDIVSVTMETK